MHTLKWNFILKNVKIEPEILKMIKFLIFESEISLFGVRFTLKVLESSKTDRITLVFGSHCRVRHYVIYNTTHGETQERIDRYQRSNILIALNWK